MLAFIKIYKTGGTTISSLLRSSFGVNHCDVVPWRPWSGQRLAEAFLPSDLQKVKLLHPRLRSIAGHRVYPWTNLESVEPNIKYFTVLRNPIGRCISFYQYTTAGSIRRGETPPTFEDWIQNKAHQDQQTFMLSGTYDYTKALDIIEKKEIFVGLMERFDESLILLSRFAELEFSLHYTQRNVAQTKDVAARLKSDPKAISLIKEANREDIQLFEAVQREVFPQWVEKLGGAGELAETIGRQREFPGEPNKYMLAANRAFRNCVYKPAVKMYRLFPHEPIEVQP